MRPIFMKRVLLLLTIVASNMQGYAQAGIDSANQGKDSLSLMGGDSVKEQNDTAHTGMASAPDHIYRMNYLFTGGFCLVASAADIYAIPTVIKSKRKLTDQEIQGLNRDV